MLKVLFGMPDQYRKDQGASRVFIDIATEFEKHGVKTEVAHIGNICSEEDYYSLPNEKEQIHFFSKSLDQYFKSKINEFDIFDFDYRYIDFNRLEFPKEKLFVARSTLLCHHLLEVNIPSFPTFKSRLAKMIKQPGRTSFTKWKSNAATHVFQQADLVNVSNDLDIDILKRHGVAEDKLFRVHYGLRDDEFEKLQSDKRELNPNEKIRVGFVGTFDPRKGANEFSKVVRTLRAANPNFHFLLAGTRSIFQDAESVLNFFDPQDRDFIEVVPKFPPTDLPQYLQSCHFGIFPSYYEGFGYGVIEMMASGLPVFAYDVPGPHDILKPEFLSPVGNWKSLTQKIINSVNDNDLYQSQIDYSLTRASEFKVARFAEDTLKKYEECLRKKR